MTERAGPLPSWRPVGGWGSGIYEATAPDGTVWRLWLVDQANKQAGYRLAPADASSAPEFISSVGGLYAALDRAGMRIAADAIRDDPADARRQLGIGAPEITSPREPLDINVCPLCLARVGEFVTPHTEFVGLGGPFRPPQSLTLEPCGCTVYIDDWMPHKLVWSDAFTERVWVPQGRNDGWRP